MCSSPAEDRKSVKRFHAVGHYLGSSNSSVRGASVNLDHCSLPTDKQNSVIVAQSLNVRHSGPGIGRCEFEQLLQRAMEILNARDLEAQLKTIASTSAV